MVTITSKSHMLLDKDSQGRKGVVWFVVRANISLSIFILIKFVTLYAVIFENFLWSFSFYFQRNQLIIKLQDSRNISKPFIITATTYMVADCLPRCLLLRNYNHST